MRPYDSREGSAVVTILGVISIVMIVCTMLAYSATQQMHASKITREMLKARLIAESGLNKVYNSVKTDFSTINNFSTRLEEPFWAGKYVVQAVNIEDDGTTQRARIISRGSCGFGEAVVSADVENRPKASVVDDTFLLNFDLLVGGVMSLKGNFYASVDSVHANGNADLSGSTDLSAGVVVSSAGTVTWKKAPSSATLLSKQPAQAVSSDDLNAAIATLKAYAAENGAVYASGADIPASPPGGVAYCTGDSSGWSKSGEGCFIFEGDVAFQGSGVDIKSVDGYPALIVLSVNQVKFNSDAVIVGAVIMPNASVKVNGHATIYGPILVGQSMTGNGTADLYAGDGQFFKLPPSKDDHVVITAWH